MGKVIYNKLIRDQIPEIIHASGKKCETVVMTDEDFGQALRAKLVEEAQEIKNAGPADLVTELADLCEVMEELMESNGITKEQVTAIQTLRRQDRGGFKKRLKLIWSGDEVINE